MGFQFSSARAQRVAAVQQSLCCQIFIGERCRESVLGDGCLPAAQSLKLHRPESGATRDHGKCRWKFVRRLSVIQSSSRSAAAGNHSVKPQAAVANQTEDRGGMWSQSNAYQRATSCSNNVRKRHDWGSVTEPTSILPRAME